MSTSNSPQTLFRFVSFRNPNLAENSERNLRFIYRPKGIVGFFDAVNLNNGEIKLQALRNLANQFSPNAIKTVATLEEGEFSELLKIGKNTSLNKKLTSTELKSAKDYYSKLNSNDKALTLLWDNLIYQYITQNNFYVKEAIAHILNGFHIGYVQSLTSNEELKSINGSTFLDVATNATIVLPEFLFKENNSVVAKRESATKELSNRNTNLLEVNLEKQVNLSNQVQDKENLYQLKLELQNIENNVIRNNEKEYKLAFQKYQKENAENISLYQNQLDIIKELEENKASEEEIKKAYEVLNRYEVPLFEFENQKSLSWNNLYSNLSENSFALFLENYTNANSVIKKAIDYSKAIISVVSDEEINIDGSIVSITSDNFFDINNDINSQSQNFSQKLLNDSYLPQDEFANIGNVLIPVSTNTSQASFTHLSYILKATKRSSFWLGNTNLGFVNFQIQLENASWNITHASISANTNLGAQNENITSLNVINNTLTFPEFLVNKFRTISSLTINIFFANGRESVLQLNDVAVNTNITGILTLKPISIEVPIDDDTTGETPVSGNHFGLKRLGIAEYMKVVQTVHAYVPGEVSNIENVMASELRHKSINELTRTEETVTTSKSQEVEKISDTNKVNRAEMQTEVVKELEKQKSFQAHANYSKDTKIWKIDLGTSFATNNSQFNSNRQAVTKSQEVTERAMERVQSKITEERIMKIIQEVSLTNVHEFDNRGGTSGTPQHITGVYRWVDKKMKNQIFNYGKRTMFEFMIPEPAKLHKLAYKNADTLVAPVDPRKAPAPHTMKNASIATKALLEYWADIYGVNLTEEPKNKQQIFKADGSPSTEGSGMFFDQNFEVEENYIGKSAIIDWYYKKHRNQRGIFNTDQWGDLYFSNLMGDFIFKHHRSGWSNSGTTSLSNLNISNSVNYQVKGKNIGSFNLTIKVNCEPSISNINAWKLENFNLIIDAYTKALDAYKVEKANIEAERKANEDNQKEAQSNFYRIIEGDVIKHNCIAYLLQNNVNALGVDFTSGDEMLDFKVALSDDLDKYTATAKFLEQAFEWSIMDYTFYPYYWADRKDWQEMYLTENVDALFRSFLQAGLARVIVTVKPGFEEAVQYFLTTGKVWLGGETPIIGDPLYVSITQEMREPTGIVQGNYWITRIPTTLTILQAKSTGLEVDEPLPIFPESNPENCENPDELENASVFFASEDARMIGSEKATTLNSNS